MPIQQRVAEHYNSIKSETKDEREGKAYFFQLRKYNNFVKAALIDFAVNRVSARVSGLTVVDLACGKGGDIGKWLHVSRSCGGVYVDSCIGVDISEACIIDARGRFDPKHSRFQFVLGDVSDENLIKENPVLSRRVRKTDIVSMQFAIHYVFSSEERARTLFKHVSSFLKQGGVFIGTTVDPSALRFLLESHGDDDDVSSFSNSISTIKAVDKFSWEDDFGVGYEFTLGDRVEGAVEYVVKPDILSGLARRYGLKLLFTEGFRSFGSNHFWDRLRKKMGSERFGEMSIPEQEVVGLYMVFAFEKM